MDSEDNSMSSVIMSLLIALRAVESTNGMDPAARGNHYQITEICVRDVNRIYGTKYRYPNCTCDPEDMENIVILYLSYWGRQYLKDTGRVPTQEVFAKIYHCGYKGYWRDRERGNTYWKKVKRHLGKETRQ